MLQPSSDVERRHAAANALLDQLDAEVEFAVEWPLCSHGWPEDGECPACADNWRDWTGYADAGDYYGEER